MIQKSILLKTLAVFAFVLILAGCSTTTTSSTEEEVESIWQDSNSNQSVLSMSDIQQRESEDSTVDETPKENQIVLFETSLGDIKIEVFNSTMPITGNNFTKLVEEGFYDDVIFHRVIPNFMAQGGDPTGTGSGGPGYTIPDEFSDDNNNERGTLSMANAGPNTGGSQFFINVVDNGYLNGAHPVFGKVIEGMDVVDKIVNVETGPGDRPLEDIVIKKATIVSD